MWRLDVRRSRNSTQWWGEVTETPSDIINDANRPFFTHCCKLILAFLRKAKVRHG